MNGSVSVRKNRIMYFDVLRCIASFAVVLLHVSAQKWYVTDIWKNEWLVLTFYDSIVRFAVPVFFMISGALFLNKDIEIKKIYSKYIFKLAVAFAFWSFIYILVEIGHGEGWKQALLDFLGGHYHMWYLFSVVGLYMLVPLLRKIVEDERSILYFLTITLTFLILFPLMLNIIGLWSPNVRNTFSVIYSNIGLNLPRPSIFYFVLGYYLSQGKADKKFAIVWKVGLCGFVSTSLLTIAVSRFMNKPVQFFLNETTLSVCAQSVFVFLAARRAEKNIRRKRWLTRQVKTISKCSFGIYLIHPFFLELLNSRFGINSMSFHPVLAVPILSIVVYMLSMVVISIIRKIPVLCNYIV